MPAKKILTLCIVRQEEKVLLGMKKRGLGMGRWNGFGGKIQQGENVEEAARRELFEEAGIKVDALEKAGIAEFEFQGNPELLEVHIFRGQGIEGNPTESEEMKPQWFDIDKIPLESMWPDDSYWFPLLLEGKKFKGKFIFDASYVLVGHTLCEIENFDSI